MPEEKKYERGSTYLAVDLGAGSGRIIAGTISENKLELSEIHRFENRQVPLAGTIFWDFPALFENIISGIARAVKQGFRISGIGVDTWGVDFGLIDNHGMLIGNPVCYRDSRTAGMKEAARGYISDREMYEVTGTEQMEINTLYQLLSMKVTGSPQLAIAGKLLFMPDLINYFLTGNVKAERTIASTSQLMDIRTGRWNSGLISRMGLEEGILPEIIPPGTPVGKLREELAVSTGASEAVVYSVGAHDTASAIATIAHKTASGGTAFLSSGTWSLAGMVLAEPVVTPEAFETGLTNEAGVDGKTLLMSNITGLWLLQSLLKEWESEDGKRTSYTDLLAGCRQAEPFRSLIDTNAAVFNNPPSMSQAITDHCRKTSQPVPQSRAQFARCVLESLAMKYRKCFGSLSRVTGRKIEELLVIGGGARNGLLNQFIADCLNIKVATGPVESTAAGNILQQAIACGQLSGWEEAAAVVDESFPPGIFVPQNQVTWELEFIKYCEICP